MDETQSTVATTEGPAELEAAPGDEGGMGVHHHAEHAHPTPLKYIFVAFVLGVVTAIEVALSYIDLADGLMVFLLMTAALIKFVFVASFFMHLKFDNLILRRLFITGILLALAVYFIVLITMDVLFG